MLPFGPGEDCVFVANDWHSALVPVLLKVRRMTERPMSGQQQCSPHLPDSWLADQFSLLPIMGLARHACPFCLRLRIC